MILPNIEEARAKLRDPSTRRQTALELGNWCRDLILFCGGSFDTACRCGAEFAIGMEMKWSKVDES